ncbi:hypothetical protein LXA43DRAFT_1061301 [Ganoderma leucocontextum]|nr:hypothetical protein LXA43DRAFT_1061301 [Ganoderma leucocontextum]
MASQSDAEIEQVIAYVAAGFQNECCIISIVAFVAYDWVVTLSREVQLFWTGKARPLSAVLYFSNKYLNVLAQIMYMLGHASMSDKSCNRVELANAVILYLSVLPPAGSPWSRHADIKSTVVIMDRVSTILADTLLIAITWKLLPDSGIVNYNNTRGDTTKIKGLASIMLRNGIMYFVVLSILNILHLVLTQVSVVVSTGGLSYISAFTPPLSSILVSHFLLDLQEAHQRKAVGLAASGDDSDPSDASQGLSIRSINFANALGSLGATIDPPDYGRDNHDEGADGCFTAGSEGISPNESESCQESRILDESAITGEVPCGAGDEVLVGV